MNDDLTKKVLRVISEHAIQTLEDGSHYLPAADEIDTTASLAGTYQLNPVDKAIIIAKLEIMFKVRRIVNNVEEAGKLDSVCSIVTRLSELLEDTDVVVDTPEEEEVEEEQEDQTADDLKESAKPKAPAKKKPATKKAATAKKTKAKKEEKPKEDE